jgi:hypothetical protein
MQSMCPWSRENLVVATAGSSIPKPAEASYRQAHQQGFEMGIQYGKLPETALRVSCVAPYQTLGRGSAWGSYVPKAVVMRLG